MSNYTAMLGNLGIAVPASAGNEVTIGVRWDPKNPPKAGQTITVTANPNAVHLLNSTTGERI